jgi:hypothetical protein
MSGAELKALEHAASMLNSYAMTGVGGAQARRAGVPVRYACGVEYIDLSRPEGARIANLRRR